MTLYADALTLAILAAALVVIFGRGR